MELNSFWTIFLFYLLYNKTWYGVYLKWCWNQTLNWTERQKQAWRDSMSFVLHGGRVWLPAWITQQLHSADYPFKPTERLTCLIDTTGFPLSLLWQGQTTEKNKQSGIYGCYLVVWFQTVWSISERRKDEAETLQQVRPSTVSHYRPDLIQTASSADVMQCFCYKKAKTR